jgi:hypothetical protein
MREIEFRGKNAQNNLWVFGYFYLDYPHKNPRIIDGDSTVYVIPETVGQYTGLKDKNGVRIFEGDVVEYKGLHLAVMFSEEYGCFTVDGKFWMRAHKEFEIIGIIHDNPELLVREKD